MISKLHLFSRLVGKRQVGQQKVSLVILYFQEAATKPKRNLSADIFGDFISIFSPLAVN